MKTYIFLFFAFAAAIANSQNQIEPELTIDSITYKYKEFDRVNGENIEKTRKIPMIVPTPQSLIFLLNLPLREWITTMNQYNYSKNPYGGDRSLDLLKLIDGNGHILSHFFRNYNDDSFISFMIMDVKAHTLVGKYFDDFFLNIRLIQDEEIKLKEDVLKITFSNYYAPTSFYYYDVLYKNVQYEYSINRKRNTNLEYQYFIGLKRK